MQGTCDVLGKMLQENANICGLIYQQMQKESWGAYAHSTLMDVEANLLLFGGGKMLGQLKALNLKTLPKLIERLSPVKKLKRKLLAVTGTDKLIKKYKFLQNVTKKGFIATYIQKYIKKQTKKILLPVASVNRFKNQIRRLKNLLTERYWNHQLKKQIARYSRKSPTINSLLKEFIKPWTAAFVPPLKVYEKQIKWWVNLLTKILKGPKGNKGFVDYGGVFEALKKRSPTVKPRPGLPAIPGLGKGLPSNVPFKRPKSPKQPKPAPFPKPFPKDDKGNYKDPDWTPGPKPSKPTDPTRKPEPVKTREPDNTPPEPKPPEPKPPTTNEPRSSPPDDITSNAGPPPSLRTPDLKPPLPSTPPPPPPPAVSEMTPPPPVIAFQPPPNGVVQWFRPPAPIPQPPIPTPKSEPEPDLSKCTCTSTPTDPKRKKYEKQMLQYCLCKDGVPTIKTAQISVETGSLSGETIRLFEDSAMLAATGCRRGAPDLVLPEVYQIRITGDVPQLKVIYRAVVTEGEQPKRDDKGKLIWGKKRRVIHIPHFKGSETQLPTLEPYTTGQWYGKAVLKDGSNIFLYGQDQETVDQLLDNALQWVKEDKIPPNQKDVFWRTSGMAKGDKQDEYLVYPYRVEYYDGSSRNRPYKWFKELPDE